MAITPFRPSGPTPVRPSPPIQRPRPAPPARPVPKKLNIRVGTPTVRFGSSARPSPWRITGGPPVVRIGQHPPTSRTPLPSPVFRPPRPGLRPRPEPTPRPVPGPHPAVMPRPRPRPPTPIVRPKPPLPRTPRPSPVPFRPRPPIIPPLRPLPRIPLIKFPQKPFVRLPGKIAVVGNDMNQESSSPTPRKRELPMYRRGWKRYRKWVYEFRHLTREELKAAEAARDAYYAVWTFEPRYRMMKGLVDGSLLTVTQTGDWRLVLRKGSNYEKNFVEVLSQEGLKMLAQEGAIKPERIFGRGAPLLDVVIALGGEWTANEKRETLRQASDPGHPHHDKARARVESVKLGMVAEQMARDLDKVNIGNLDIPRTAAGLERRYNVFHEAYNTYGQFVTKDMNSR